MQPKTTPQATGVRGLRRARTTGAVDALLAMTSPEGRWRRRRVRAGREEVSTRRWRFGTVISPGSLPRSSGRAGAPQAGTVGAALAGRDAERAAIMGSPGRMNRVGGRSHGESPHRARNVA